MKSSFLVKTSKYIKLRNGLEVHYQESGGGKTPILFVPGWTMTTDIFHRQLEFFEGSTEFRFITLDPRSHGKTAKTQEGNHYEQHGRDLNEFIQALELDNLILCGWSFGTLATLSYVNQFNSSKLGGFIMLDGPPRATGEDNRKDWVTYSYADQDGSQEFFTMGKLRDPANTNTEFARWMLQNKKPEAVEWIVRMTEQTPNSVATGLNATAVFLDYREDLINLGKEIPTWCVVRAVQYEIVANWCSKHLPLATLSGFGEHMMFWEQSQRFNAELKSFLDICIAIQACH